VKLNEIEQGDCRELCKSIPDNSVDLIFTDPPYLGEYLPIYYSIFETAPRILKPDGFLLIYVGGFWKDEIMAEGRRHLKYFWDYIVWEPHNSPVNWPRKTIARNKSILAYHRKDAIKALPNTQVLSVWLGGGEDKRYHVWGQDESCARYYIDCFSKRGDLVYDPCCGGGTTPAVCKMLGRNYISNDISQDAVEITLARLDNVQPVQSLPRDNQHEMDLSIPSSPG
jgi:site-specific DNA-methyltransferase (adenine-specific)